MTTFHDRRPGHSLEELSLHNEIAGQMARHQCARDFGCDVKDVPHISTTPNAGYDPKNLGYPEGEGHAGALAHDWMGDATHTVEVGIPNSAAHHGGSSDHLRVPPHLGADNTAVYKVNTRKEQPPELWSRSDR